MKDPFADLNRTQISKIFNLTGAHFFSYRKGEEMIPTIKKEDIIGIIISGYAHIIEIEYNGSESIQEFLPPHAIFGTKISSTNDDNYQLIAKQDTEIVIIDYDKLLNEENLNYSYFNIFLKNIFTITHDKIKEKNERIKILRKKQIRERLLTYFELEYRKYHQITFLLSFSFKDLADYIAVDRSAMFREIKVLKEENIIKINGKKITLLYK